MCELPPDAEVIETDVGDDIVSLGGESTRAKAAAGDKRRGVLPPSYWQSKLALWDAMEGPVDKRIATQATCCVERTLPKATEGAKALRDHSKAYTLAKSTM